MPHILSGRCQLTLFDHLDANDAQMLTFCSRGCDIVLASVGQRCSGRAALAEALQHSHADATRRKVLRLAPRLNALSRLTCARSRGGGFCAAFFGVARSVVDSSDCAASGGVQQCPMACSEALAQIQRLVPVDCQQPIFSTLITIGEQPDGVLAAADQLAYRCAIECSIE